MNLTMTAPCANCPFRTDIVPFIRGARAKEIADGLTRQDQTFQCHKTVDYEGDDDGNPIELTHNAQHCAGALIMLEHMERPNQLMRWFERCGGYDRTKLKMDSPVYRSAREFIAAHVKRDREGACRKETKSTAPPAKKSRASATRTARTTSGARSSRPGRTRTKASRSRS